MKKRYLVSLIASLMMCAGAAQAEDIPASLTISGQVTAGSTGCTVYAPSELTLNTTDMSALPFQGEPGGSADNRILPIYVESEEGSSACDGVGLRFSGISDESEGNAFKNTMAQDIGASGIGVGLYTSSGGIIEPNKTSVLPKLDHYELYVGMVKLKNVDHKPGVVQTTITVDVDRL